MGRFQGGDVIEVTFNHPTVGDGSFFVKSGEDTTFDPGGFRNEDDANGVAGDGSMITKKNRVRWMFEGPLAWDMNTSNEIESLREIAESPLDADFTIEHINGTVWGGTGTVVGDIQGATQDASIPIKLAGGNRLKKIVG